MLVPSLALMLLAAVLPEEAIVILETAPRITVYSLSPDERAPLFSFKRNAKPSFHDYRVLSSTELTGEAKSEILGKLYTAMAEEGVSPARCFNPRHGVRADNGKGSIDLVICFECKWFRSYAKGKESRGTIGASPEQSMDAVLRKKP